MAWQPTLQAVPLFAATSVAVAIAVAAGKRRETHVTRALIALAIAAAWWSLLAGLELLSANPGLSAWLNKATYLGIAAAPVAWLVFVLAYTGRGVWLTRTRLAAFLVVPAVSVLAAVTNEPAGLHTLFWTDPSLLTAEAVRMAGPDYGPLFWLHTVYSYSLLAVGSYWLLELAIFSEHLYRVQAVSLLGAVVVPWTTNALYLGNVIQTPYDPTIIGIVLGSVLLLATIRRHRLLEVVPAARELARAELLETLADPVVIVDGQRRVIDLNPAAVELFGLERVDAIGRDLETVTTELATWLADESVDRTVTYEVDNANRYYDVQVTTVGDEYGTVSGRLLSLRDVTDRRHHQQQISVLNRLLRHNLSNAITTIHGNAELAAREATDETIRKRLAVIEDNAAAVMDKRKRLDRVLRRFEQEQYDQGMVGEIIGATVASIRSEYPEATVTAEAPDDDRPIAGRERLRIALEEILTNAIVHNTGDASTVDVSWTIEDGTVRIAVADDGPGIPDHEIEPIDNGRETKLSHGDGVGLWLVSWLIHSLDGSMAIDADHEGTHVTVRIPVIE